MEGIVATDIGNKSAIRVIAREFYQNIYTYYEDFTHWKAQSKADYLGEQQNRTSKGEGTMWIF